MSKYDLIDLTIDLREDYLILEMFIAEHFKELGAKVPPKISGGLVTIEDTIKAIENLNKEVTSNV